MEITIYIFLALLGGYLGIGLLFALWFVIRGATRLDPLIRESSWRMRLLLFPGAIATWIFLLPKFLKKSS